VALRKPPLTHPLEKGEDRNGKGGAIYRPRPYLSPTNLFSILLSGTSQMMATTTKMPHAMSG